MNFWQAFMCADKTVNGPSALVSSIQYQLQVMLSAEAPLYVVKHQYRQVKQSSLCFGLDSFNAVSSQMDALDFARQVEDWIQVFEPNLSDVSVEVSTKTTQRNQICLTVHAHLINGDRFEELAFNSNINLSTQLADIKEESFV